MYSNAIKEATQSCTKDGRFWFPRLLPHHHLTHPAALSIPSALHPSERTPILHSIIQLTANHACTQDYPAARRHGRHGHRDAHEAGESIDCSRDVTYRSPMKCISSLLGAPRSAHGTQGGHSLWTRNQDRHQLRQGPSLPRALQL